MGFERPLSRIVIMSQSEIENPTSRQLDDHLATYVLDSVPYTRYWSNGSSLVEAASSAAAAAGGAIDASEPQYGGTWDGTTADDTALQAAIDDAASYSPRKSVMLPPLVCLRTGVHVPRHVHIVGYNYTPGKIPTVIYPHASASLTTGFMFNMATVDGTTPDSGSPQLGIDWRCGVFGVYLNVTPNLAGIRLAIFCDTLIAHDIHAYRHTQLFKKVDGQYIDNIEMRRITCSASHDNSEWQIELGLGGQDAMLLEEFNFPNSGAYEQGIKISLCSNGRVSNILNGTHYFYQLYDFELSKFHMEYGSVTLENPHNVRVTDFWCKPSSATTTYPLTITATGSLFYGTYSVLLENYSRSYQLNADNVPADISLHYTTTLHTINCKTIGLLTNTTYRPYSGIKINNQADAAITTWNDNSHYLSQNGYIAGTQAFGSHEFTVAADFTGCNGTVARYASGGTPTTALVNGTRYYYYAQYFTDISCSSGQNQTGAEISQTTNANNQMLGFPLGYGTCSKHGVVKVYRGSSAGLYDKFVVLNSMASLYFHDTGTTGNGIAWSPRGAAGVDTITSVVGTFTVTPSGGVERTRNTIIQAIASGASPAVNCASGAVITITVANNPTTFGAPSNVPAAGEKVTFVITQDGTGGRALAWNAAYKGAWPTTSGTLGQKMTITGVSDGTNLVFQSASAWY
jgi:hypothetical protein